MTEFQPSRPTRRKADLAEVVEMLLDKGIVINADIVVSVGDTQLLGIQVRAAIASFETAAKYGLEFPEGTDMRRVAEAAGDPELAEMDRPAVPIDPTRGVNVTPEESGDDDENGAQDSAEEEAAESEDASTDGGSFPRRTDEATDYVGTRPDPKSPTQGGHTMLSDVSSGDVPEEVPPEPDEADESEGEAESEAGDEDDSSDAAEGAGDADSETQDDADAEEDK